MLNYIALNYGGNSVWEEEKPIWEEKVRSRPRVEIDGWVIDAIKAIGIDTAKAVLNAPREMLIEKTDLEEETVDEVIRILKSEFEEEPAAEMEPETEAEPEAEPTQE